ncbi:MAG: type II toxin-antitoxin system VapB family antitoxin [Acidobacteriota bacterium]|nr:type II toxin-antitoxin system VapB family antitoxin [Acidobacteriota bacterium]
MTPTKSKTRRKALQVDEAKLRRVQEIYGVSTEAEAVERALDEVLTEHERNRLAWRAHARFLKSGGEIKDVYGLFD